MLLGHVMPGGMVSMMLTENMHELVKPYVLVAVHVTLVTPYRNSEPEAGVHDTLGGMPLLSDAVAANVAVLDGALLAVCDSTFPGQLIDGGGFWFTATLNEHDECRSVLSYAMHVTVVAPSGNDDPLAWSQLMFLMPLPSEAVTVYVTGTVCAPLGFILMLTGQLIMGVVVS